MHVILTVNFSPWSGYSGGGQRSTHELACALAARGLRTSVIYTRPPWERVAIPSDLPYAAYWAGFFGLRSRSGAPLRTLNAITVARQVRQLLDGEEAVVHTQGEEGALVPGLRPAHRFGFVATPRYPKYPAVDTWLKRVAMPPKFRALGRAVRHADRWCPTSEASAVEVRATYGVAASRCTVVPNGLADAFLGVERSETASQGPIVFHGRLSATKGAHLLIEALASMRADAPPLVVCGRGPEEGRLRALAERLGVQADFVGWQSLEALAERLAGARLAVLPSREESFGNAMAEAMAAGAPLVSTRVGSIPELVPDGAGVLVPPDDPEALAAAITSLLGDVPRCEAMAKRGAELARARYSWAGTASAFETIYREVLPS